ncbi:hypothetical protein ACFL96_02985 [Thermoproteota archaeon]
MSDEYTKENGWVTKERFGEEFTEALPNLQLFIDGVIQNADEDGVSHLVKYFENRDLNDRFAVESFVHLIGKKIAESGLCVYETLSDENFDKQPFERFQKLKDITYEHGGPCYGKAHFMSAILSLVGIPNRFALSQRRIEDQLEDIEFLIGDDIRNEKESFLAEIDKGVFPGYGVFDTSGTIFLADDEYRFIDVTGGNFHHGVYDYLETISMLSQDNPAFMHYTLPSGQHVGFKFFDFGDRLVDIVNILRQPGVETDKDHMDVVRYIFAIYDDIRVFPAPDHWNTIQAMRDDYNSLGECTEKNVADTIVGAHELDKSCVTIYPDAEAFLNKYNGKGDKEIMAQALLNMGKAFQRIGMEQEAEMYTKGTAIAVRADPPTPQTNGIYRR